jgi:hypothetical protein
MPPEKTDPPTPSVRLTGSDERPVIEVTVAAPVATVWPHLRDPELIRRWHGWEAEELDAEIDYIFREHSEPDDEAHVLRMRAGDGPATDDTGDRFEAIAVDADTTVVRITRGPRGISPDWDAMYDDVTSGWISFLAQLKFAVEAHPGIDRRTVFRGRFGEPGPRLHDLLGMSELPSKFGEPYRITADDAPQITGRLWYRAPGQVGLTATDYGPGLVIIADTPSPEPGTASTSMIIVSTFGLSEDQQARVDAAWSAWWSSHFPHAEPAPAG